MRELKVVGLDVDGKRIICESDDPGETFILRADDRLRAAMRGDKSGASQTQLDVEVPSVLRPKEIQARIRAGASIEQVAEAAGVDVSRVAEIRPPGLAGTLARGRAGNRGTSRSCRRARGAHAAGDRDDGVDRPRPRPRRHQLGRLAQRGRALDGPAVLEGRAFGQRRALPVHTRRAWWHRHRASTTPPAG